jgi:hypothetical protein
MISKKIDDNDFKVLSLLILLNIFTGRFFENIIFFNIPLNFIILFFLFLKSKLHNEIFTYKDPILKIFFFYLLISLTQLLIGFNNHGIWALRDGLYFLNMFFFFIAYFYSINSHSIDKFDKFLSTAAFVTFVYVILVLLNINNFGPTIISPQGNNFPLINFFNLRNIFVWVGFYLLIQENKSLLSNKFYSILLIGLSIISFQSRTSYLTIFILAIYFVSLNKISINGILKFIFLLIFIFLIFNLFNLSPGANLSGRLTNEFSIDYLIDHISTLFVFSDNYQYGGALAGPENSALARYGWWTEVIEKNSQSLTGILFGQGFGVPLIDFKSGTSGFAREPHNMFISVYGRQGLIGLLLFCIIIFKSIIRIHKYINSKNISLKDRAVFLSYFVYILVITIGFIGDSILNYSSASLAYFIFMGYILGYESKDSH